MKIRVFFEMDGPNSRSEAPKDLKNSAQEGANSACKTINTPDGIKKFNANICSKPNLDKVISPSYSITDLASYMNGTYELPNNVKLTLEAGDIMNISTIMPSEDKKNYLGKDKGGNVVARFNIIPQQPPQSDKNTESNIQSGSIEKDGTDYRMPLPNKKAQPPDIQPSVISSEKFQSPNDVIRQLLTKNPGNTLYRMSMDSRFIPQIDGAIQELIQSGKLQPVSRGNYGIYSPDVFKTNQDRSAILEAALKRMVNSNRQLFDACIKTLA